MPGFFLLKKRAPLVQNPGNYLNPAYFYSMVDVGPDRIVGIGKTAGYGRPFNQTEAVSITFHFPDGSTAVQAADLWGDAADGKNITLNYNRYSGGNLAGYVYFDLVDTGSAGDGLIFRFGVAYP